MTDIIEKLTVWAIPLIFAITLHEAAHAWVAYKLGDNTAKSMGRVSFNPMVHIDLFGTVLLPLMLLISGSGFLFGYAKPVPVNFSRLNNPRRDSVLVALAGPGANIILIMIAVILFYTLSIIPGFAQEWFVKNLFNMILINAVLAVFNMLPIPPLDGGRVAVGILPYALARPLSKLEPYGMLIILGLIFIIPMAGRYLGMDLNILWSIIGPVISFITEFAFSLLPVA
ncbi:MAG: site-2 protease family protein [Emcibacteraceae bacterium]|nr:site-2 protease family protein [Emcibacteraceae bacterium]